MVVKGDNPALGFFLLNILKFIDMYLFRKFVITVDAVVAIFVLMLLLVINLRYAIISSSDSYTFIGWADVLIGNNFNLKKYYEDNLFVTPPVFYTLPVGLIALLKVVVGEGWKNFFYVINIISLGVTIELFRRSSRLLNVSPQRAQRFDTSAAPRKGFLIPV